MLDFEKFFFKLNLEHIKSMSVQCENEIYLKNTKKIK